MPRARRRSKRLVAAAILALAGIALHAVAEADSTTLPAMPGAGEVTIYRDDWGVPHIYARREADGYFGLGYAQAQDQVGFILDVLSVLHSRGASSKGAVALAADVDAHRWRHLEEGRAGWQRLSPQLRRNYEAYTRGIERFLSENPERRPSWLGPIEPWTWVAWSRFVLWQYMILDGQRDCAAGGVKLSAASEVESARTGQMASNAWALARWRTADNAPMLLSDPHGGIDGAIFHEFHVRTDTLDAAGFAFGPLMLLAHNSQVAWGMTTGAPDVSDCFELQVDPAAPRRYRVDGKWHEMVSAEAGFEVKDAAAATRTFEYTRSNGVLSPVVARNGDKAYVISTAYMDAAGLIDEEIYRMVRARSLEDVRVANRLLGMFPQNLLAADRGGHLYYLRAGRTPRRPSGYDWTRPVDGSSTASAWRGVHPVEDLVQVLDPPQGYMQNSNVEPAFMMDGAPAISKDKYPSYIYYDNPQFHYTMRGSRTKEVLSRAFAFTVADAKSFAVDEKWFGFERWQSLLREALNAQAGASANDWSMARRTLAQRLLHFDGFARADSRDALAFYHWRTAVQGRLKPDQLAELDRALRGAPLPQALQIELTAAVDAAADDMTRMYGGLDRKFGDVFRIGRDAGHSWPLGGGVGVNVANFPECRTTEAIQFPCPLTMRAFIFGPPDSEHRRLAIAGSRALRLVVLADPIQTYTLHNFGQSSDPASPHYDDQARLLVSEAKLKPGYFAPGELQGHVSSARTLRTR